MPLVACLGQGTSRGEERQRERERVLPIFPLKTSHPPRDTHLSRAQKVMFKTTKKGNIGTPEGERGKSRSFNKSVPLLLKLPPLGPARCCCRPFGCVKNPVGKITRGFLWSSSRIRQKRGTHKQTTQWVCLKMEAPLPNGGSPLGVHLNHPPPPPPGPPAHHCGL